MDTHYADMHIHIGRDMYNQAVKITGSSKLTLTNILKEASRHKGIDMIGIIDTQSPNVRLEIRHLIDQGLAYELPDGGIRFEEVTLILGSEIEVYDKSCQGPIHVLCYFPFLKEMDLFSNWLSKRMKNITLSSQRYYGTAKALQYKVKELSGVFIPAHVFTPFKGLYGKGVKKSLKEVFDPTLIDGIELGLSADIQMADQIEELHSYTYLSNSDAHSLGKIAREYQQIYLKELTFKEFFLALHQIGGRKWIKNYGMNPKLGKYYSTVCQRCLRTVSSTTKQCLYCGSKKVIKGVFDRIQALRTEKKYPPNRPLYMYQVPLEYLPTLGPKTYQKLLKVFQTEMNVLHYASYDALKEVVSISIAEMIINMRKGQLHMVTGGGGKYGRISEKKNL